MAYTLTQLRHALREKARRKFLRFGSFRRVMPFYENFGAGIGLPIDRYYVEAFLHQCADDISGQVLEVGGRDYTRRFGTGVKKSVVLTHAASPAGVSGKAEIVGDLSSCPQIANSSFDAIVLTQTLHYLYDMPAAVRELHRILAPGGVLLCTVPCISQISRFDMDAYGDRWRLTSLGLRELLEASFEKDLVSVSSYGNALSALSFIEGLPADTLRKTELDARVADFELLVCARAQKKEEEYVHTSS
jgi:SAM-dependent methyltransferase